ncbi:MAG: YggT family protein [Deltaproteobacteria bacterium]|nr:YggT family protein [Deltaproteobacteria bacterium]
MYLIKSVINLLIVILLLRLMIRRDESYHNQIYSLIYRFTDYLLIPIRNITRSNSKGVLLTVLALIVIRGLVYMTGQHVSAVEGIGLSLLELLRLVFQAYMVMWFVTVLSDHRFGMPFTNMIHSAFLPLNNVSRRLGIPGRYFNLFSILFLVILYALIRSLLTYVILFNSMKGFFPILPGLGEGLLLIIYLFPGFFTLVIIIGALLSWVHPDPSNPVVQTVYGISEPLLSPFRRLMPQLGGIDFSPIIAILCFQILGGLGASLVTGLFGKL